MASSILADAAESSPSARPAFSPAVAIQRHPEDDDFRFTVRAGRPPGPWWLVIQRQLGPLYLEQIGFDSAEVDGRVSSVTLLFDGRVEMKSRGDGKLGVDLSRVRASGTDGVVTMADVKQMMGLTGT